MKYYECVICGKNKAELVHENYPGYIEKSEYEIINCKDCNCNFILNEKYDKNIYKLIYSNKNLPGYDRYHNYSEAVKRFNNPLKYLASCESTYYPAYKYLLKKSNLDILEVGCGLGYTTYSLNKIGMQAEGIDISKDAISFANQNYGSNYYAYELSEFIKISKKKYDLIIANELIEHLPSPVNFISDCLKLLKPNGEILITTPNKNYSSTNTIWNTDMPPVHTIWLSKESFISIGNILDLKPSFISFRNYFPKTDNRFLRYFRTRSNLKQISILKENGQLNTIKEEPISSIPHTYLKKILINFSPIRFLSNLVFNIYNGSDATLGVVFRINNSNKI